MLMQVQLFEFPWLITEFPLLLGEEYLLQSEPAKKNISGCTLQSS